MGGAHLIERGKVGKVEGMEEKEDGWEVAQRMERRERETETEIRIGGKKAIGGRRQRNSRIKLRKGNSMRSYGSRRILFGLMICPSDLLG